jgi:hypothetical protein
MRKALIANMLHKNLFRRNEKKFMPTDEQQQILARKVKQQRSTVLFTV